ncbi:MAG: zinc-ribbon domain-containing protein [Clostridia bacterium]|nr:zinc-ribbon domain-containing protein [Clostridia bacterium]
MKFCTHCGKEVMDDAVICPNCGCSVQYDENQQGAAAPQFTAPQPQHTAPVDNYSTMSILGLVLSFFTAFVGLIVSILAYNEAKRTGSVKSQSMAKAGIIIGAVEIGIGVFTVVIYLIVFLAALGSSGMIALI